MEKVAPWRSTMTVYGRPDNASADDEAPARVPTLSVFILLCQSDHLPYPLLCFLHPSTPLFLPLLFSCLSHVFFCFPAQPHLLHLLVHFTTFALPRVCCLLRLPLRIKDSFFMSCVFLLFFILFSTTMHIYRLDERARRAHTRAHKHKKRQNCGQILFMTGKGNIEIVLEECHHVKCIDVRSVFYVSESSAEAILGNRKYNIV